MDNKILSLQYLETLSSADLISLADDYGIDIPDNLNRRFIIGELLEIAAEMALEDENASNEMTEDESHGEKISDELPSSFNATEISVVIRNPAWAYVYWDISEAGVKTIEASSKVTNIVLRVSYYENEEDTNPVDFYDVSVDRSTRAQYVLLEANRKFFRVDLVAVFGEDGEDNIAVSRKVKLPETPAILKSIKPGDEISASPLLELSGLKKIIKMHYEKYRQSFTE